MKEMSFFEKNMHSLRERYPDVAKYLESDVSVNSSFPEEEGLAVGVNEVGNKLVLCAQKEEISYRLDSLYDSNALLDIWYNSFAEEWNFGAKLLMYGLGNGMYARYFLKSARKDCTIVVHEPSEKIFRVTLEYFDISDLLSDKRLRLVFWPLYRDHKEIKFFYEDIIEYKDLGSIKMAIYANYPRLFGTDCGTYLAEIDKSGEFAYANQVVHDRFGEDYNRNFFANLKFIPDSLSYDDLIRKMPEDIPAIVVAAGPSLDKNINELKAAKGKCLLISTDTALKPLALAGIEPDLSAIMDGKKDARYLSEDSSKRIPMFCTPRSGDTFMNLHTGVKFFTNYFCNHIKKFMDEEGCFFEALSTGGSVANSCFGLAESLKCRRIILVGQDLAYTGDKTHSTVTVRGEKATAVEDLEHVVMGTDINGDPIRTSKEFALYKGWFEDEIKRHPGLSVIDATEGGIRIEGTTLMTLKEAIEKECTKEFDFGEILSGVGKLLPGDKKDRFVTYIAKIPGQLGELKRLINVSLSDYASMRRLVLNGNYHSSEFKRLFKESDDISKRIENSPVIEYVHNQLQGRVSDMLDKVNKIEKDERSELLSVCDLGEKYLNDMLDAISELEPYVKTMKTDFGWD